jgi:hypothetical protein
MVREPDLAQRMQPFALVARPINGIGCSVEGMGRQRQAVWLATALCALAAAACGGASSSPCSNPPAIAGDWSGTILSDTTGGGRLTIRFDQTECTLGGAWSAQFADPADDSSGSVQGTADASGISFDLVTPVISACGYGGTASLDDPNEMTGQFSTTGLHCTGEGSFSLLRQATPSVTVTPMPTPTPSP